jgi:hypothetical protein
MSPMWREFEEGVIDSVISPTGHGKSFTQHAADISGKPAHERLQELPASKVEEIARAAIEVLGAKTAADIPAVIKEVNVRATGFIDSKSLEEIVRKLLS